MKNILIFVTFFISATCFSQAVYVGNDYDTLSGGSSIEVSGDMVYVSSELLMLWLTFNQTTIGDSLILDSSDYNNNWTLDSTNCIKFNANNNLLFPVLAYIPFDREFWVSFYASLNTLTTAGICGGGRVSSDHMTIANAGLHLSTPTRSATFASITTPSDDVIRKYVIHIETDSITAWDSTRMIRQIIVNPFGHDSIAINRIGAERSVGDLNGYLSDLNLNNERRWPMQEGRGSLCYDVIRGDSATMSAWTDSTWRRSANIYPYNLKNGYSIFFKAVEDFIRVPYMDNGDTMTTVITTYPWTMNYPAGDWHNGAETAIVPPISLLPYDVNNYLFDVNDIPRRLFYENFIENLDDQIFMDVHIPYQYHDLQIYNTELK
jgi:hypothetical protein